MRRHRNATLSELAAATGFSISTLSRLESGKRRPTLELLIPLARIYDVPLDELVGAPASGDPRLHMRPRTYRGRTIVRSPAIAEFDTRVPHWIGSADGKPVEILNLFGPQGERAHTTARIPSEP